MRTHSRLAGGLTACLLLISIGGTVMTAAERDVETTNKEMPRRRNLWVTCTLQWEPDARLPRPANPTSDSEASAFQFVASCLFELEFALSGKRYAVDCG